MDGEEFISAAGERAALGGYVPQFREFAWQAYRALVAGTLEWVRLADPEAQKLDDIQYATLDQLHAYQVKWTIAGNVVSFADFKKLFAGLVSSWQRLRQLGRAAGKQVYGHLLTNKPLSEHDSVPTSAGPAGTFAEFYQQVWLRIRLAEPYDTRWQPAVAELCALAGLSEAAFREFGRFFVLHPAHAGRAFSAERAGHSREDADLTQLFAHLLQQVSDPSRPVELLAGALARALGWEGRLRTTFNHELVVDQKKYQPLTGPLTALDALLQVHAQGYLFLAGSPGSGKSTLLTEWARTRSERVVRYYAFDFANPSSLQNSDERGDSTQLYFDLVQQLRTEGFYPATVLPHRDLLFLHQTLAAQLQSLGDDFHQTGRRTLLVIDGLDHVPRDYRAATKSFLRDLPPPAALPEGVYVVLGSQSYELADLPLAVKAAWQQPDRRVQMEPLGRPEVKRYCAALRLETPLTPPQQELLWVKSQGHPLYLSYLCERLQSGEEADRVLSEAVPIGGDIDLYYRRIWQTVGDNEALTELLGLLARILGAINPEFVREWGFAPAILQAFRQQVRFLFTTSPTEWAFFHNSFRQFLRQQTAPDYLADDEALDVQADADYHRRLADYYHRSRVEYTWHASHHLYQAGEQERFLAVTTPEALNRQLADFRPTEEVRQDLALGVEVARQRGDVALLTRYLLAMSELSHREFNLHLPDLVEELLELRQPAVARNYLRNGRSLRAEVKKSTALRAAGLFDRYPEGAGRAEAAVLFGLGEPASIRPTSIVVEAEERFEEDVALLKAWVEVAPSFYPVSDVLRRLNHLEVRGRRGRRSRGETTPRLRRELLAVLGASLSTQQRWAELSLVTQSLNGRRKADRVLLLELLHQAIEESRSAGSDLTVPAQYLGTLLATFEPASTPSKARIIIANLLYKVTGDPARVLPWIAGLKLPLVGRLDLNTAGHLGQLMPLVLLYKLQCLTGRSVPVTEAVPSAAAAADALVVDFQRMLCLVAKLLADGASGAAAGGLVPGRVRPLVRFYYQTHDGHRAAWYQLTLLRSSYFDLLVVAVAGHGPAALQELTQFLLAEFTASPGYWPADTQRRLLLALHKQGIAAETLAPALRDLEPELLGGHSLSTRLEQCQAQARAWLRLGDATAGETWLRRALGESFGVGYRKDYQFNVWLDWLRQFLAQCPAQAPQMLGWFVARLPYLEEATEGPAYRSATEKLLSIALNWNLAAGCKLLIWQLREGYVNAAAGLRAFLAACLPLAQTAATYGRLMRFYAELVLLLNTEADSELIEKVLATGQALGGRDLLALHLPDLLVAIERRALQNTRAELLTAVDDFMQAQGYRTTDFHPAFVRPVASAEASNRAPKNELALPSEPGGLCEADVLARAVSFDGLRQLVQQAGEADSFFKWDNVLEQVGPALSGEQLAALATVAPGRREAEFIAALSHLALRRGERELARSLAEQSVAASAENGWATYFDGGTRLVAFAALNAAAPDSGPKRAFDVFARDLTDGSRAGMYADYLEEILPLLTSTVPFRAVWAEVFAYLQRLLQASRPLTELPDLEPEATTVDEQVAQVLLYLAQHLLTLVQQQARHLLAANLAEKEPASLAGICRLAVDNDTAAEAFVETVQRLPAPVRRELAAGELRVPLQQLAIAPDYWVRRQARQALEEAAIARPELPGRLLPAGYASASRIFPLVLPATAPPLSRPRNAENRHLIRPFEHWLPLLADPAGLGKADMAQRLVTVMHTLDQPENWTRVAETQLWDYARRIGLEYSHPNPRAETARRALMRVTTELLDSGTVAEALIYEFFTFRDYDVYHLPEITRPAVVPALGRHEHQAWVAEVAQHARLSEGLPPYGPLQVVIGEQTQLRGLSWGSSTEDFQMHLTIEALLNGTGESLFGSAFQQLTANYYNLPAAGPCLLVRRDHRFNQFDLKSAWLAFNPSLAHNLGWQPDPARLFAWQTRQGEALVESVYWMDGNPAMRPYQHNSEVGEGWLVLASPAAVQQLHQLGMPLLLEKKITRSKSGDEEQEQTAYSVSVLSNGSRVR